MRQQPIVAYGKTHEHTGITGAVAGATAFSFSNTSNTIGLGDHVFCSDQSGAGNQYLGVCTVTGTGGISTHYPLQTTPGTSLKIWSPTAYALFAGLVPGSQRPIENDGTLSVMTEGGTQFNCNVSDPIDSVQMDFTCTGAQYALWRTFRRTSRVNGTKSFSLAFSNISEACLCYQVKLVGGEVSMYRIARTAVGFSARFTIENADAYVTA
jgi:hypothetical protein